MLLNSTLIRNADNKLIKDEIDRMSSHARLACRDAYKGWNDWEVD